MAQIVNVTDTFSFWREQFNALVGEVGVKKYFKTPQDFGAVGDPAVNDTAAFDLAQNQPLPVYIPPGVYYITKNYTGANKFFDFGGVSYVGGGSVVPGFSLDAVGSLLLNKNIFGLDPAHPQHLTTKNYVDAQVSDEASARSSADTNLQNQINLIPTPSNWYNNGILRVKGDGGTELGQYVDFHSTSTAGDFDVRVASFFGSDSNRIPWTGTADHRDLVFWSSDATIDGTHGRFPNIHHVLTDGWTQYNIGRLGINNPILGGFSYRHAAVQQFAPYDWQNDGKSGHSSKEFLTISNQDSGGGAVICGKQRRIDHSSSIKLHAIRNNDIIQNEWQAGALYLTANRYDRNATPQSQLLHNEENVFTVANNDSVRLTLKGDGRLIAPNCSIGMIQGSSTDKILTTKEYVDSLIGVTNSNTYTKSESDTRFVNSTGDSLNGTFVFGNVSQTFLQSRNLSGSLIADPGTAPFSGIEVFQPTSNKDAMMRFHIAGDYAVHFGLDGTKNDLAVGGYSLGPNSYRIMHEGNMGLFSVDQRKTSQGTWWNNGFLKVDTAGVTELGKVIDFHHDATATSKDWDYRIEAYPIPAFASYGLKFNNNSVTALDIKGNHVHAPNADVNGYNEPDSGRMLVTKEYLQLFNNLSLWIDSSQGGLAGTKHLGPGLIMKWVRHQFTMWQYEHVLPFDSAFPNNALHVQLTVGNGTWISGNMAVYVKTWTAANVTIISDSSDNAITNGYLYILALGY